MTKTLIVYLNGEAVGRLRQDKSGAIEFRYSEEWLARTNAMPLSRSLPLQSDVFRGKQARPFFAGVLPEETPRKQIASILGISERNDFAMLERIGGECAGAVSLLPDDITPPAIGETRLRELNEKELQEIVKELPRRPLMADTEGVRLSLAGAQNKIPVAIQGSRIFLPLGNTPSTHILKPEPELFPGLADNEIFCMTLAKTLGLNVADVESRPVGTTACIVVRRYDRTIGANNVVSRLHQEDFCQALGFPPEHKYQQEGGPLLRDCIALLREWSTTPVLDIRAIIDGLIFNVLIGNADAHGKNFSMIYPGNQRRLAPFYDLVCTTAWPELSKTPAMKIGQSKSIDAITPAHWQKMAQETRLGWPMIRDRIAELGQKTVNILQAPGARLASLAGETTRRVARIVMERASSLIQALKE